MRAGRSGVPSDVRPGPSSGGVFLWRTIEFSSASRPHFFDLFDSILSSSQRAPVKQEASFVVGLVSAFVAGLIAAFEADPL